MTRPLTPRVQALFDHWTRQRRAARPMRVRHPTEGWLKDWADLFDRALDLGTGFVTVRVEVLGGNHYAEYRYGERAAVFNAHQMDRPPGDLLRTLLHELIHARLPGHGHDEVFQAECARVGITEDGGGRSAGPARDPFRGLLRARGVAGGDR